METEFILALPFVAAAVGYGSTLPCYVRRNGGLLFWRIGRLGGSFYLARH